MFFDEILNATPVVTYLCHGRMRSALCALRQRLFFIYIYGFPCVQLALSTL